MIKMVVPVSRKLIDGTALTLRNEETVFVEYDLSQEGERDYAEMGDIEGRFVMEFDINRGELLKIIDRIETTTVTERIAKYVGGIFSSERRKPMGFIFLDHLNKFWEKWEFPNKSILTLDYGKVVLVGAEPINEIPGEIDLTTELPAKNIKSSSASELRRDLHKQLEYKTSWEKIEQDIESYLEKEGIKSRNFKIGVPIHLQARAEPYEEDVDIPEKETKLGTEYTITIKNNRDCKLTRSKLHLTVPSQIGREIEVKTPKGEYDPSKGKFKFKIRPIQANSETEIVFRVPQTAEADLQHLEGKGVFNSYRTYSYAEPYAVFDAGGNKIAGMEDGRLKSKSGYIETDTACSYEIEFSTPIDAIFVSGKAEIHKKIRVEGVTPPDAAKEIEKILLRRGIEAEVPEFGREDGQKQVQEGMDVWKYNSEFRRGSVLVDNSKIIIGIKINGERKMARVESQQTADDEMLPERRQSVQTAFGKTGVELVGHGRNSDTVDEYLTDLRNDIKTSLEAIAEGKM